MREVIIDTNAVLRFILNDIPSQHLEIYDLVKKAKTKKIRIVIPEIVMFETYFTLKSYYEYNKEMLMMVMESLLSADYLRVEQKQIFMKALHIYQGSNLGFVDCFLISKSQVDDIELFTFDKDMKKVLSK